MRVAVQAGFAAKGGSNFKLSIALDRLQAGYREAAYRAPVSLQIGGVVVGGYDIAIRERKRVAGAFGDALERDPTGRVVARALYAIVNTPTSKKVGVTCSASVDQYDRARCLALLDRISSDDLPGGAVRRKPVVVAGTKLRLKGSCWSPDLQSVYCNKGGLNWWEGSRDQMKALFKNKIDTAFGMNAAPD